jgi:hypothetical protein
LSCVFCFKIKIGYKNTKKIVTHIILFKGAKSLFEVLLINGGKEVLREKSRKQKAEKERCDFLIFSKNLIFLQNNLSSNGLRADITLLK